MFDLSNPYELGLDIVLLSTGLLIGLLAVLFARANAFYGLHFLVTILVAGIGGLIIGRLLVQAGLGKQTSIDPLIYLSAIIGAVILLLLVGFLREKTQGPASA